MSQNRPFLEMEAILTLSLSLQNVQLLILLILNDSLITLLKMQRINLGLDNTLQKLIQKLMEIISTQNLNRQCAEHSITMIEAHLILQNLKKVSSLTVIY